MKKLTLALAATAFVASPAIAQDTVKVAHKHHKHHKHHQHVEAAPVPVEVLETTPASPFAGPYLGASIGFATALGTTSSKSVGANGTVLQSSKSRLAAPGVVGGINMGWDWVSHNKYLMGIDMFGDLASLEGKSNTRHHHGVGTSGFLSSKVNLNWTVGAGLKFGTIVKDALLYTSVHWVGSEWEVRGSSRNVQTTAGTINSSKKEEFKSGVRVGLGASVAVTPRSIFSLEGGYSWYESITAKSKNRETMTPPIYSPTATSHKHRPELFDVKAKLAWKFRGVA